MSGAGDMFGRLSGFVVQMDGAPERVDLDELSRRLPLEREMAEQLRDEDIHATRKAYLDRAFHFAESIHLAAICLVLLSSLGWVSVPTPVLIALVGTMCLNVLGVLGIAFKWLFPLDPRGRGQ